MTRSTLLAARVLLTFAQSLLLMLALCWPSVALAREVPPLRGHVNDTADMLPPEAEQKVEQKLTAYEQKSGQQLALLTIDSLDGDALEDFSIRTVEAWKLGKKGKDDGLLLLIVKNDRKLRIEVGYGLEGDITDAFSARVIRNVLTPALRAGQVEQGVEQAFDVLMKKASGEAVPETAVAPPRRGRERGGASPFAIIALLLFLLPFLLPLLLARGLGRRRGWMVGGLGGFGGGGGFGGSSGGGGFGGGGGYSGGGGGFGGGGSSGSW